MDRHCIACILSSRQQRAERFIAKPTLMDSTATRGNIHVGRFVGGRAKLDKKTARNLAPLAGNGKDDAMRTKDEINARIIDLEILLSDATEETRKARNGHEQCVALQNEARIRGKIEALRWVTGAAD